MKSPHEILVEIEDFVSMKLNEVRQWLSEIGHPPPEPEPTPPQPVVDNGGDNPAPTPAPKPAPDYPDQETATGNDPTGGSRADMP